MRTPILYETLRSVCLSAAQICTPYGRPSSRQAHVGTPPFGGRLDSHQARWPQPPQVVARQRQQRRLLHDHASGIERGVSRWKAFLTTPLLEAGESGGEGGGSGDWVPIFHFPCFFFCFLRVVAMRHRQSAHGKVAEEIVGRCFSAYVCTIFFFALFRDGNVKRFIVYTLRDFAAFFGSMAYKYRAVTHADVPRYLSSRL